MAKAKIYYLLSEAGRKDSLLKGGDGREIQMIEADITPEILKLAKVNKTGEVELYLCKLNSNKTSTDFPGPTQGYKVEPASFNSKPYIAEDRYNIFFDSVQTAAQLIKHDIQRIAGLDTSRKQAELDLIPILEEYRKNKSKEEENIKAFKKAEEAKKLAMIAEKAVREKRRRAWILAHGSQYLRDCLELNVMANLEYVVELVEFEFPGYTVDYAENIDWEEKFSPSVEALSELKRVRGLRFNCEIVWLKSPALVRKDDDNCYHVYEPREAVVITDYLGKYTLVKEI